MNAPNFALYYVGDGYSTAQKIMGRQSAGKSLMRGVARKWQNAIVNGFGNGQASLQQMVDQLKSDGFTSKVRWFEERAATQPQTLNAVYFPAPLTRSVVERRNVIGPTRYSLFGVTHTLSSKAAMDQIADLILPPFQPWDGLICTSAAALGVVDYLHEEARDYWASTLGATRFNPIAKAIIPLGVNAPDFTPAAQRRAMARNGLDLNEDEVCFLFAGRMTFHGKANPVAFYQAVEAVCQRLKKRLVCIEAGIFSNDAIAAAFREAQQTLAPSARFIGVNGKDQAAYDSAWAASDVFVSLSDNIQETFGITPVEAMAAGLPVIVSDWNGYKDTVRDGVDGFRIPVTIPSVGVGAELAARHESDVDTYDMFIGRVSMATAVDTSVLTDRIYDLATNSDLRQKMGQAGRQRVCTEFDWPIVLDQYTAFATELGVIRSKAAQSSVRHVRPSRPDPFALFAHYPTSILSGEMRVIANPAHYGKAEAFMELGIARYVIHPTLLPKDAILGLLATAAEETSVANILASCPQFDVNVKTNALMWLMKMNLLLPSRPI